MARRAPFGLPPDRGAARLLVALGAMTLLLWTGGSSIVPLLPAYLRGHGSRPALIGVVMAAYYVAAVLTQYPAGRVVDRFGARRVLAGGLGVFVVGSAGFALVSGAGPGVAFRAAQGVGGGAVSVAAIASVARRVEADQRGRSFAFLYGAQSLAFAVGPLLGGIVGVGEMRSLFLSSAVLAAVGLALVLVAFPSERPGPARGRRPSRSGAAAVSRGIGRTRREALVGALAVFAATGVLAGLYDATWSLLLLHRGATSFEIGLSWTLYCLPYAACSAAAGRLADRSSRRALALVGMLCSAGFAVVYPALHAIVLLLCFGSAEAVGAVIVVPAALSMAAEWTADERHGAVQGALETARTAATAAGAAAGGALFGIAVPLPFDAAALAIAACALVCAVAWRRLPARAARPLPPGATAGLANPEVSSGTTS